MAQPKKIIRDILITYSRRLSRVISEPQRPDDSYCGKSL